jgi:hypothetical protein
MASTLFGRKVSFQFSASKMTHKAWLSFGESDELLLGEDGAGSKLCSMSPVGFLHSEIVVE